MSRIVAIALLALGLIAPAAGAADRTDPIPASVGPVNFRSYFVNPTANLPAGLSSERWLDIARRAIVRWGATYSGTTTKSPDDHTDGVNVIGFPAEMPGTALGYSAKTKSALRRMTPPLRACSPVPGLLQNEHLVVTPKQFTLKLRKDTVRKGKVRKRTVTIVRTVSTTAVGGTPVAGERCVISPPSNDADPGTLLHESDILLDTTPSLPWYTGAAYPTGYQYDLETVLLHELGHAAGLAHQPQDCDPSTPMRPTLPGGVFWRGIDEVSLDDPCAEPYPVTPDTASGPEPPFAFGPTLAGASFLVNPIVPEGYDSARFVAVAQSIIERWGGTFGGTTTALPDPADGVNVVGFDVIPGLGYEVRNVRLDEQLSYPAVQDCTAPLGTVNSYSVKQATRKVRVKVRGRRRTLTLRADRVVTTKGPGVPSGSCVFKGAHSDWTYKGQEIDIAISKEMEAYELGPAHPVLGTRIDMASMLAAAFGRALGIAKGDRCAGDTPVVDIVEPGDWWRSPTDVKRAGDCSQPPPARVRRGARTYEVVVEA